MCLFGLWKTPISARITLRLVTAVLVVEIKVTVQTCTESGCPEGTVCTGSSCIRKVSNVHQLNFSETWYFWVGIVASILMFLGFLTLCICYLKRSLAMTLSLVHSIPNDMVMIRTVQDPNGIIRPEVTQYTQQPRTGKPPPQDASAPEESNDSMLPLDPAYPPVRTMTNNSNNRNIGRHTISHRVSTADRNNQNLADIILPPGYILQPNQST